MHTGSKEDAMRALVAALIIGLLMLLAAQPAAALRLGEAERAIDAELDRLKVDRARVTSVFLAPDAYPQDAEIPSYTGFVSFADCRGNLVIDLSQTAAVRTLYTTGDCRVPGVD